MATAVRHARVPNTCEYTAQTDRGDYLVQVAWPLCWGEDRIPPENEVASTFTCDFSYLVDGNAYFFTAVDIARRLEFTNDTRTVVVGVGYPPSKYVYDFRRGPDLTPATADGKYEMPLDDDGNPRADIIFGEASEFLDFIQNDVMSYVQGTLFPQTSLHTGRKALFGHSYGGIFTLNAMFTRPTLFNTFIAGSPIIWWNNESLVTEQEAAFRGREHPVDPSPSLLITWGDGKQDLIQQPGESEEAFRKRKDCAEDEKMRGSANRMVARLEKCSSVRSIHKQEFQGEDHGSAAVVGLQLGLSKFLVEKM
ncbi:Fc.00g072710.m01.CDS01 [Cosmosporella sp. VM-42]